MTRRKVPPHPFVADPDLRPHPNDIEQRAVCGHCHLLGKPGDARHAMPAPVEDGQSLAAGEREGEG
jgi:hypothetical protein